VSIEKLFKFSLKIAPVGLCLLSMQVLCQDENMVILSDLNDVFEARNNDLDPDRKRLLVYVNGMQNSIYEAQENYDRIVKLMAYRVPNLQTVLAYNQSRSFKSDLSQVIAQQMQQDGYSKKEAWYQTALHLLTDGHRIPIDKIKEKIAKSQTTNASIEQDLNVHLKSIYEPFVRAGYDIVILAHSQGNFFANSAWQKIRQTEGATAASNIRVVGVGTPANYTANGGDYVTNSLDLVIQGLRQSSYSAEPRPSNILIPASSEDPSGHALTKTYLGLTERTQESNERIINYVVKAFSLLNEEEETLDECDRFAIFFQNSENHTPSHDIHPLFSSSPKIIFKMPEEGKVSLRITVSGIDPYPTNGNVISAGYKTEKLSSQRFEIAHGRTLDLTLFPSNGNNVRVFITHPTTTQSSYDATYNIVGTCSKD